VSVSAIPPRLFLDANAGEPLRPAARQAMLAALEHSGNPASVHAEGRAARRQLEDARATVARLAGIGTEGVVFTGSATESNFLALHQLGRAAGRKLLVSAAEHDSLDAPDAQRIPVGADGALELDALEPALRQGPALLALHLAQNETGVIQDFPAIAALVHAHGGLLHADAAQAPGRIGFAVGALGADSLTLSAHKAGGPKGCGALLLRPGLDLPPAAHGGGQERRRRPGTEALPAIAGFAAALADAEAGESAPRVAVRDAIAAALRGRAVTVAETAPRLPNTLCLALPGAAAETQVIALDLAGIAVSAGSACSSGKVGPSRVLAAMGFPHPASAIRVSVPWNAPVDAAERFVAAWQAMAARFSRRAA
jgi:cysteine desulfurase